MQNLKTDWVNLGSSGKTIDGRVIPPEAIISAGKTYDKTFFTAQMFVDHDRVFSPNYGQILEARSIKNSDGSYTLQGIIQPNESYIYDNRNGQNLFLSMELLPDFPNKGDYYLIGCAPTDKKASTRTTEIRFSTESDSALFGEAVEAPLNINPEKPSKPSFFSRLRGRTNSTEESDMADKATLTALQAQLATLQTQVAAFTQGAQSPAPAPTPAADPTADKFAMLEQQVAALTSQVAALKPADPPAPTPAPAPDAFKTLQDQVAALKLSIDQALATPHSNTTVPPAQSGATAADIKAFG